MRQDRLKLAFKVFDQYGQHRASFVNSGDAVTFVIMGCAGGSRINHIEFPARKHALYVRPTGYAGGHPDIQKEVLRRLKSLKETGMIGMP